jgi:uncharacterized membrane protein
MKLSDLVRRVPAGVSRLELSQTQKLALGLGVVVIGAAAATQYHNNRQQRHGNRDSAPGRTARQAYFGDYAVVGRTVTIHKPRGEIYKFWRDFKNLPQFMENIEAVETGADGITDWTISAPAGTTVHVKTRIVEDRENELISWRSTSDSDIDTEGKVMFRDAPGDRGTEVEAIVAYVPPAGQIGRFIAKLFQCEPRLQGRRELKRLKMLMETGEIATSQNRKSD